LLCRLAKRTLFSTAVAIRLEFDGPQFAIEWSIGKMWKRQVVGDVQNIRSVDISPKYHRIPFNVTWILGLKIFIFFIFAKCVAGS
jgi:hypothetical protein